MIFAKAPVKGLVKTRLKKDTNLTDEDILQLYTAFLMDAIIATYKSKADAVYIAYLSETEENSIRNLIKNCKIDIESKKLALFSQKGDDFDTRFINALKYVAKENGNIVVIGSDAPHIQPKIIDQSFEFLAKRGGIVLGPSGEGGVYLIGLKSNFSIDFKGVFTSGIEIENLSDIAERKKLPLLLLNELLDIDVASDLITLICNLKAMKYSSKFREYHLPENTINIIEKLGLRVGSSEGTRGRILIKKI